MTTVQTPALDLDALRAACPGGVVTPTDETWDAERVAFNITVDQQPAVVALPASAEEVAAVVAYARDNDLRVVPQTTGHNAAPLGSLQDAVLLKTSNLRFVELDTERRIARVGGGTRWEDVTGPASEQGMAVLHGSSPDVGIAGYSLGGGMGWYARKHGLQCNHVTAVEVVTGDGTLVRATADEHPDLFWALRGGGGSFGVVTALEFELFPVEQVYAGALFFPWERASEVLKTWHGLLGELPEEMTSVAASCRCRPCPTCPSRCAAAGSWWSRRPTWAIPPRQIACSSRCATWTPRSTRSRPSRPSGSPSCTWIRARRCRRQRPRADHRAGRGTIDEIVALTGAESTSPLVSFELRHTGGALGREEDHHGARASLPGSLAMFAVGIAFDAAAAQAIEERVDALLGVLAPYAAGHYPNFVETAFATDTAFGEERWERLRRIKAEYDPTDAVRGNHAVTPAD